MKLLLSSLIISLFVSQAYALDKKKCSACRAVADALSTRISNERPRNHIDARHRLDKDGKRYGKVIDFKISELRAIELLDDLCKSEMDKYHLEGEGEGEHWILTAEAKTSGSAVPEAHLLKLQRQVLRNTCADIIGRWEDDLAVAIREGKADAENMQEVLCVDYTRYCPDLTKDEEEEALRPADEL